MKKILLHICNVFLSILLLIPATAPAQTGNEWFADLTEGEQDAINALVLYPEETRLAILEVSKYPEALIKMETIQGKAKTAFQTLLEPYPQSAQELIWDLTRYPGLVERLAMVKPDDSRTLTGILDDYPAVIHERAREAARSYTRELAGISLLNREAEAAFEMLLIEYPEPAQKALRHLLELPEVLSIMTDNIKLTILIGDLYQNDPQRVLRQADSLNLVVAREQAQELADWRSSLEENPEARAELEASAEAFGEEHGYYYDDYYYDDEPYDDIYYQEPEAPEVHHYYYYHYPYWFAYPYWYAYPRWREYPYWYDWGFYFGPRRAIVVVNLPSFYFVNWYFYHPYHHYRWSHLSAHFARHYYGHRDHGGSITAALSVWQSRNRAVVSKDWLRDDGRLTERFREFGEFEADRARYNRNHPQQQLDQEAFRERNADRYRTITRTGERPETVQPVEKRTRTAEEAERRTTREPEERRVLIPRKRTVPAPQPTPEKRAAPTQPDIPTVKRGTERHRSISEQDKTTRTARTPQAERPQTKAPRTTERKPGTATKKSTPRKKN